MFGVGFWVVLMVSLLATHRTRHLVGNVRRWRDLPPELRDDRVLYSDVFAFAAWALLVLAALLVAYR